MTTGGDGGDTTGGEDVGSGEGTLVPELPLPAAPEITDGTVTVVVVGTKIVPVMTDGSTLALT